MRGVSGYGWVRVGAHLALREDLELPADPLLFRRTKGQSSYSSGDQFSLGRSKVKLGCACKSTAMPVHRHTATHTTSTPLQNRIDGHKAHATVSVHPACSAAHLTEMLAHKEERHAVATAAV